MNTGKERGRISTQQTQLFSAEFACVEFFFDLPGGGLLVGEQMNVVLGAAPMKNC